ncbi:MAG: HRDC domain-containing protein [Phycisphaerales bacterium]|nr:HRDC domain-containing protein [Phycisphaerales bacterium]
MQIRIFALPMDGDEQAAEECNKFLRGQRVLSVQKTPVVEGGRHFWSVCVEYLPRAAPTGSAGASTGDAAAGKPRIDYRELLSAVEFVRFAKLRQLRKRLADAEAVPVYTLFTNSQLAELARRCPHSKAGIGAIEGLGAAKVERYGDALLALLSEWPEAAAEAPVVLPAMAASPAAET